MADLIEPVADVPLRTSMTGHATASRKGLFAWLIYEWAHGPFFITFAMFTFSPYFARELVGDPVQGQAAWTYLASATGFIVAILSILLGPASDSIGPRKPGIALFAIISIAVTFLLWFPVPGMPYAVALAAACYLIAGVTLEIAALLHNSMLPAIVSERRVGALSGMGYAFSYFGAIATFVLWLALFEWPATPAFGLGEDAHQLVRVLAPVCAIWMMIFAVPLFIFTPDLERSGRSAKEGFLHGLETLTGTFKELGHYKNIALFLVARVIYYDGMTAVFAVVAVYAAGIFDWSAATVVLYGLALLIVSSVGATIGGFIDDWIGAKATIIGSIILFGVALFLSLIITPEIVPWLPAMMQGEGARLPFLSDVFTAMGFVGLPAQIYVFVGAISAFFVGPALASSRSMLSRIIPPTMSGEFFGLYNMTGKMTAFMGTMAIAVMTQATGSQRAGMGIIYLFLIGGVILMLFVKEERTAAHTDDHAL